MRGRHEAYRGPGLSTLKEENGIFNLLKGKKDSGEKEGTLADGTKEGSQREIRRKKDQGALARCSHPQ